MGVEITEQASCCTSSQVELVNKHSQRGWPPKQCQTCNRRNREVEFSPRMPAVSPAYAHTTTRMHQSALQATHLQDTVVTAALQQQAV